MLAMLGKICVFLLLFPIFGVAAEKRMDMSGGVVNGPIMLCKRQSKGLNTLFLFFQAFNVESVRQQ